MMQTQQHPAQLGMHQNAQYYQQQQQQAQLAQQRNNVNMLRQVNRPRSLINILTNEEENNGEQQQMNKQKFNNSNGKGLKRACKRN